jgi:hypothetical protein
MNKKVIVSGVMFCLALLFSVFGGNQLARGENVFGIVLLIIGFAIFFAKWKIESIWRKKGVVKNEN